MGASNQNILITICHFSESCLNACFAVLVVVVVVVVVIIIVDAVVVVVVVVAGRLLKPSLFKQPLLSTLRPRPS
jgi:hypothetical protein